MVGVWTGDNRSRWGHILLNLQQLTGLNMCGFLYCGAGCRRISVADATEDLGPSRWTELGMFTPLFRKSFGQGNKKTGVL
ncbi:MAG: TIM-barrel domain-containing protein [Blautia faecis]